MTTTASPVTFKDEEVAETILTKKISRLERLLGPDNYRVVVGLARTPASIAGFVLLTLFILIAVFTPFIAPPLPRGDPYRIPRDGFSPDPRPLGSEWRRNQPPLPFWWKPLMGTDKWVHVFGTASGQYDIFYGVIWGVRTAFKTGVIVVVAQVVIGMLVGSIAAYYGGLIDNILMRIVDVFLTLPFILAALILAAVLTPRMGKSVVPTIMALIAFGWMGYSRLIRGDILSVRERDYILAARVVGVKDRQILFKHIIPNAIFPTMVLASLDIGTVSLSFAALSFLGVGTEIGYADWGQILAFARSWITSLADYWYIVVFPGLILVLFVLAWNLIGDALRDVLDPKMRGKS